MAISLPVDSAPPQPASQQHAGAASSCTRKSILPPVQGIDPIQLHRNAPNARSYSGKCPFLDVTMTNLGSGDQTQHATHKLAGRSLYGVGCQQNQCHAAMMDKANLPVCDVNRPKAQVLDEATEFLTEFYRDAHPDGLAALPTRLKEVENAIENTGYYYHTTQELEYGVKLAWRNSARCIMRVQWKNIQVHDARGGFPEYGRQITNQEIYDQCVHHLKHAVTEMPNGNKVIKSFMTVFPQILPGDDLGRRIWNSQLLRFAGYTQEDGSILGDPANAEFTDVCLRLGWTPPTPKTPFDVLPLIIQASDTSAPLCRPLPDDAVLLIPISHPEYPQLAELQLKWHAIPAISSFTLDIGGIQYPCAPFNGWYMDAEIACRNLADVQRYNLLPIMARAMGLDLDGNQRELAKDSALVELAVAVLSSFDAAQVTMVDHLTASESFTRHYQKEMDERGFIPADWVWLTPPIGGAANTVFHQEMINFFIKPNFLMPRDGPKQLLERAMQQHLVSNDVMIKENDNDDQRPETTDRSTKPPHKRTVQLIHLYYGSETGVSEAYARELKRYVESLGGDIQIQSLAPLDDCDLDAIAVQSKAASHPQCPVQTKTLMVVVTSTFGAGGPPANAATFYKSLQKNQLTVDLSAVDVAIFGLGSSLYANFNACAQLIEAKLRKFGANVVLTGVGDETKDPRAAFRTFRNDLVPLTLCDIEKHAMQKRKQAIQFTERVFQAQLTLEPVQLIGSTDQLTDQRVRTGRLVQRIDLVTDAGRETARFDFDGLDSISVSDGDHVAILPQNDSNQVTQVLKLLGLEGTNYVALQPVDDDDDGFLDEIPVFLRGQHTLATVLSDFVDLHAAPSFALVQKAATVARTGTRDKILLQYLALSTEHYDQWVQTQQPSIARFLETFPSIKLPLGTFLRLLSPMAPRLYSLSSSTKADSGYWTITARSHHLNASRSGLATSFLWRLQPESTIRMYLSPSPSFHLPVKSPVILIANGSGIAPFRGFWRTLVHQKESDRLHLYYGCRSSADQLYREEVVHTIRPKNRRLAFSREETPLRKRDRLRFLLKQQSFQPKIKYVTDWIRLDAAKLRELVHYHHAKVFVCGTQSMATSCRQAFIKHVLQENETRLAQLQATGQYVEEVF